jgi:hypothetical protein
MSHFIPLAGHLAIAGLSHSGRSTLILVRLLPIDVGSVRHDAFSGSALIQKREKRNRFFIDRLIEIETILSRRRFLDVVADPIDDSSGRSASPTIQPSASLTSPRKLQTA